MTRYIPFLFVFLLFPSCETSESGLGADDPAVHAELVEATIEDLQRAYADGSRTVEGTIKQYLDRIAALDDEGPRLNAIIQLNPEALNIARTLDERRENGEETGPLFGVPVVLKDNIDTGDEMPNTAGARVMRNSHPPRDAYIVERLRAAGAVVIGKANLSEWANFHSSFSSSGWSSLGGQTKNPYDLTRNPCGSSAGSGVAVAANLTVIAIGTETNGSIVCPSNNNGIVGVKPTVGLLSRSGIIPISDTQDTPGPMTRTVRDAAIALGAMTGVDPRDGKTAASEGKAEGDYTVFLDENAIAGKRIGIYTAPLGQHWRVDTIFRRAVAYLESRGATTVEIDRIEGENVGGASFRVLLYEFRDGIDKYLASLGPEGPATDMEDLYAKMRADSTTMAAFDHDLFRQALETDGVESASYRDDLDRMLKAYRENGIDRVMDEHRLDAIVAPTGGIAWKTDPTLGDRFGVFSSSPAARAGYPSVTVPMGTLDDMPLNISFFGRAWSEPMLLGLAYAYERGTGHRIVPTYRGE